MTLKTKWAGYICVFSTAPDMTEAERIADALVTEKLVACVTLFPEVKSVYWWKDEIQHSREVTMMMKTRRKHLKVLEKRINELHPYEIPEIIAISLYRGSEEYLNWIYTSVKP